MPGQQKATKTTGINMMGRTLVSEFLKIFGSEELLERDALGMSAVRHALLEDEDPGFCQDRDSKRAPLASWKGPKGVPGKSIGRNILKIP